MTSKHITAEGIRISFVCMILFFDRLAERAFEYRSLINSLKTN